tara:strand:+ start:161 stop:349 length:189 start_codon:yes stop_codon:yes gene_type:complete
LTPVNGYTWPEQDIIDNWIEKHKLELPRGVVLELKNAVTAYRVSVTSSMAMQYMDLLEKKST